MKAMRIIDSTASPHLNYISYLPINTLSFCLAAGDFFFTGPREASLSGQTFHL